MLFVFVFLETNNAYRCTFQADKTVLYSYDVVHIIDLKFECYIAFEVIWEVSELSVLWRKHMYIYMVVKIDCSFSKWWFKAIIVFLM